MTTTTATRTRITDEAGTKQRIEDMEARDIMEALIDDGFLRPAQYGSASAWMIAHDVKEAARTGCLVWTRYRVTTMDNSRLDLRVKS